MWWATTYFCELLSTGEVDINGIEALGVAVKGGALGNGAAELFELLCVGVASVIEFKVLGIGVLDLGITDVGVTCSLGTTRKSPAPLALLNKFGEMELRSSRSPAFPRVCL